MLWLLFWRHGNRGSIPRFDYLFTKSIVLYSTLEACSLKWVHIYCGVVETSFNFLVKNEEISPPDIVDFCFITDNTYTKDEVSEMEKDVLKFLDHELSAPMTETFLRMSTPTAQESSKGSLVIR